MAPTVRCKRGEQNDGEKQVGEMKEMNEPSDKLMINGITEVFNVLNVYR